MVFFNKSEKKEILAEIDLDPWTMKAPPETVTIAQMLQGKRHGLSVTVRIKGLL